MEAYSLCHSANCTASINFSMRRTAAMTVLLCYNVHFPAPFSLVESSPKHHNIVLETLWKMYFFNNRKITEECGNIEETKMGYDNNAENCKMEETIASC